MIDAAGTRFGVFVFVSMSIFIGYLIGKGVEEDD